MMLVNGGICFVLALCLIFAMSWVSFFGNWRATEGDTRTAHSTPDGNFLPLTQSKEAPVASGARLGCQILFKLD